MEKEKAINYIIQQLNSGDTLLRIGNYLRMKDIGQDEFAAYLELAENEMMQERLRTYPQKNKRTFILWVFTTLCFGVLFLFILPNQNIAQNIMILSIFGAVSLSFCLFYVMLYYKSWEVEFIKKVGKPKLDLQGFAALAALPVLVFYFLISWSFNSNANAVLKETQEDAVATIIDGTSVEGRRINFADITVQFKTKEGITITAIEDVSTYKFKQFYKGQKLNIVYSKSNPHNIDLLIDIENIRELKNSAERAIEPKDLLHLLDAKTEVVTDELNKISYGWVYDSADNYWMNEKDKYVLLAQENKITLITSTSDFNYTFPQKFLNLGFEKISITNPEDVLKMGEKVFEKGNLNVNIKSVNENNITSSIVTITRKQ
jgi:hypothetical protein